MSPGRTNIEDLKARGRSAVELVRTTREGQWLERKSARIRARDLADTLVAFANAEGGVVVVGIRDGRIEGIDSAGERVNEWRQAGIDFTEPPVRTSAEIISCRNDAGWQDRLLVLEVSASDTVHVNRKGEVLLRVGDESRRLSAMEAQELHFDKGVSRYDATTVDGTTLADLDPTRLARYLRQVRATKRSEEALDARGLARAKDDVARPTVAGHLILGIHPQRDLPGAFVRLLRYAGTSLETGERFNAVEDRRLEGPIPAQLDEARRLLRRWLPRVRRLGATGRFEYETLLPEFAWLEAITNAVCHRSYSLAGDHIRVSVFDNRVEIESPGRLPGLVRVEKIRSTRYARNPRIARALNDLGCGRELGEGVDRMFEEMRRAGLPDPVFVQGDASVRVTLRADTIAGRLAAELPLGSQRLVEHLSRHGRATTTDAVDLLAVSRPTALKQLKHLAEARLVEHVGTSLKDPTGYWRLLAGRGLSGGDRSGTPSG